MKDRLDAIAAGTATSKTTLAEAYTRLSGEAGAFSVCFLQKQTTRRLRFAGKARFSRSLTARVAALAATGAVSLE